MRSSLLLPLAAVVVATGALTLPPAPPIGSEPSVAASGGARAARSSPTAPTSAARATGATADGGASPGTGRFGVARGAAAPRDLPLRGRWSWPLSPRPAVLRPFVRPATRYGAGHRGIDLAGSSGQDVLAVDEGLVTHVGRLAGRGTVTVLHASGVRSTYEPVDAAVAVGAVVAAGTPLGQLAASGAHCEPTCLHLGAVRGEVYLDPLVFLLGGRQVRLLPLGQAPDG